MINVVHLLICAAFSASDHEGNFPSLHARFSLFSALSGGFSLTYAGLLWSVCNLSLLSLSHQNKQPHLWPIYMGVLNVLTQQTELSQSNTHINYVYVYLYSCVRNKIHKYAFLMLWLAFNQTRLVLQKVSAFIVDSLLVYMFLFRD